MARKRYDDVEILPLRREIEVHLRETTFQFLRKFGDAALSDMCRKVDVTEVKGKVEKIAIYEVFAWQDTNIIKAKTLSKDQFEKAVLMKILVTTQQQRRFLRSIAIKTLLIALRTIN